MAELEIAMDASAALTTRQYRMLRGAPPSNTCDCCSCNATRNHKRCYASDAPCECFDDPEFEPCDPRVVCQHCGTCMCTTPDDEEDDEDG